MAERHQILQIIQNQLEPLSYVIAMWQGGAAAFDRVDQWSDIDVQFGVEDDRVEETFAAVEAALAQLEVIESRYRAPMPTWHGHDQGVLALANTSPFLFIDLVVMKRSAQQGTQRFLEPEVHGNIIVHFDKEQWLDSPPLDRVAHRRKMLEKLEELHNRFRLLQVLTLKELARGNTLEAHTFYQNCTLRPYVELLRMKHSPTRYGFHTRYIHYDLPPQEVATLQRLTLVADATAIERGHRELQELFYPLYEEVLAELLRASR